MEALAVKKQLNSRLKNIDSRLKRIEDILELSPTVTKFSWKQFNEVDQKILFYLLRKDREGATTTEIATALNLKSPDGSGRVSVYRRLRRIERISRTMKGLPIVLSERKRWTLNFDDFSFHVKEDEL
uniref:Uncharacterized protein n=1 Tax=viral metagenome TaxID=1070528 RepID=A0A6M3M3M2_9ZZZZ